MSVTVAILDSGINPNVSHLSNHIRESTGFRFDDKQTIIEDKSMTVTHEHGTMVALVIKHLCQAVTFININILNEKLRTDGRILIHALNHALHLKPDIIHLSLGTKKWRYKWGLQKIVDKALQQEIVIVAAASNDGKKAYPACLKDVIGVKMEKFTDIYSYRYHNGFFYAPLDVSGVTGFDFFQGRQIGGCSTSAAYITGHLSRIKAAENTETADDLIMQLKRQAMNNNKKY